MRVTGTLLLAMLTTIVSGHQAVAPLGPVEMTGEWQDGENFSGVVMADDLVVLASDEVGFLQVGRLRREPQDAWTIARAGRIALVADPDTELDVEGLALTGNTLYGIGSHSATRSRSDDESRRYATNRERLMLRGVERQEDREVLFRFPFAAATFDATPGPPIERISLADAIRAHDVLRPFADAAGKENGVDIEGIAADGDTLLVGFRGPVLRHGFAPVMRLTFEAPADNDLLFVPLDGRGVRDLATVTDGVLILAGPTGDSDQSHDLYWWNGRDCVPGRDNAGGRLRWLGVVPSAPGGKAEALAVTEETADAYTVVIFYDSRPNGEPRRLRVPRSSGVETAATSLCGRE